MSYFTIVWLISQEASFYLAEAVRTLVFFAVVATAMEGLENIIILRGLVMGFIPVFRELLSTDQVATGSKP
jgi:hypothetical protein